MTSRTRELRHAADEARDFPANTCGASRHVDQLARDLLSGNDCPAIFTDEPEYCAESMFATVVALWSARRELIVARGRIRRLIVVARAIKACDVRDNDVTDALGWLWDGDLVQEVEK